MSCQNQKKHTTYQKSNPNISIKDNSNASVSHRAPVLHSPPLHINPISGNSASYVVP
jgi:hypothetical protein